MARAFRKDTLLLKNMVPRLFFFFFALFSREVHTASVAKRRAAKVQTSRRFLRSFSSVQRYRIVFSCGAKFLPKGQDRPVNIIEKIKNIQKHEKIYRIALFLALRRPFFKALFFSKFRNLFLFLTEVHFFSLTRRTRETNEKKNS